MLFSPWKKTKPVNPKRILIACVAESREPFLSDLRFLFRSLAAFGGALNQATKIAYFVDAVGGEVVEELGQLGVIVKIVDRFNERYPHANKLRMLQYQEDYDVLVALDCDVVIARDFLCELESDVVMAKPVDFDPLTLKQWRKLFRYFAMRLPRKRYLTTLDARKTIPYFNSGVIVTPRKYVDDLSNAWESMILKLDEAYLQFPDIDAHRFFTDQFALALALNATQIPFKPFPIEMNCPLHISIHPKFKPDKISPYVMHHHHRISSDGVMSCMYENISRAVGAVNAVVTLPMGNRPELNSNFPNPRFDNGEFWESRYTTNMKLGSGLGSRGENLAYKQQVVRKVICETPVSSVLDVGCGDLEVVSKLPLGNYVGVDISKAIIERNHELKPNWSFLAGDFLRIACEEQLAADLVICLDVLIHEHDRQRYAQTVEALVKLTKSVGLIGAYQLPPRNGSSSDITVFHEPITETLGRVGATDIRLIGYYRDTSIVCYRR